MKTSLTDTAASPLPLVKCLLVDDLDENLLALSSVLAADGVEVLLAHSGFEALEILLAHDVSLALVDVQMPGMDGFELAELMRGSQRTRHVPIIFLTAGTRDRGRLFQGYESGAVDFLHKPVEPHVLKSKAEVFFQLYRQKLQLAQELLDRTETLRLNEMFMAVLGHDLRNPLSSIIATADLIQHLGNDEAVTKLTSRTITSAMRMSRMIDDLLDLGRARLGGGIPLNHEQVDLATLVEAVVQEHRSAAPTRTIELRVHGDLTGLWDPARLGQAASNLIGNALQHGLPSEAVEVVLDGNDAHEVVLSVSNGGAIPDDTRQRMFDPFQSGDRRPGTKGGLGLGLYIVQQIVTAHGGSVDAAAHDGRTTFRIDIPRRPDSSPVSPLPHEVSL
jgi:signal transduction histidine kinase